MGGVNFYRQIRCRRAHLLMPSTALTKKGANFEWTPLCTRNFREIKKIVVDDALLAFPYFSITFYIFVDASIYLFEALINQFFDNEWNILVFFSKNLNKHQLWYPIREKELLSFCELLQKYCHMLTGHKLVIYTHHLNFKHSTTEHLSMRVMFQHILLEEYGVDICHIDGHHNEVTNMLSCFPCSKDSCTDTPEDLYLQEFFLNRCL